jgi:hypothetical protein
MRDDARKERVLFEAQDLLHCLCTVQSVRLYSHDGLPPVHVAGMHSARAWPGLLVQ